MAAVTIVDTVTSLSNHVCVYVQGGAKK